jgi:hypothetical protein
MIMGTDLSRGSFLGLPGDAGIQRGLTQEE